MKKTAAAATSVFPGPGTMRRGCKICMDTGRPEKEYMSHFPRGKDGTITCPVLLNTECGYCHDKGHTVKYCPVLAAKKEREGTAETTAPVPVATTKKEVPAPVPVATRPKLIPKKVPTGCISYASIAALSTCGSDVGNDSDSDVVAAAASAFVPVTVVTTCPAPWATTAAPTVTVVVKSKWGVEEDEDED